MSKARNEIIHAMSGRLTRGPAAELLDAYLNELADRVQEEESRRHPGTIYGAIRRICAAYYANLLRWIVEGDR